MNIHSVMAPPAALRRSSASTPPVPKREAILRAATDVFAGRGFFNAQVADVARAAGVAASAHHHYFRSKDVLLVTIAQRTLRAALADQQQAVALRDAAAQRRRL